MRVSIEAANPPLIGGKRAIALARANPGGGERTGDARLLLMVVRARFAEGTVPFEHVERLAVAAEDPRLTPRLRLRAAEALARLHMAAMRM